VIKDGPFRQTNNTVRVPEGHGLGVELDPAAMKRWHKDFVDNGPGNHFHDPKNPGRYRRLPLN
jgi:glucarate dehydratase